MIDQITTATLTTWPVPYVSCTAKAKTTGHRCRRRPHPGTTVCFIHGAGARQVRKKAKRRIDELKRPAFIEVDKSRTISIDDLSVKTEKMILKDLEIREIRRERASRKRKQECQVEYKV